MKVNTLQKCSHFVILFTLRPKYTTHTAKRFLIFLVHLVCFYFCKPGGELAVHPPKEDMHGHACLVF